MYTSTRDSALSTECTRPVTNPIAAMPSLGHSRKTTRLKLYWEVRAVVACLVTPNTVLTTGTRASTPLIESIVPFPIRVEVTSPIK